MVVLAPVRSPKSVALPFEAKVIKSMMFKFELPPPGFKTPPALIPLVGLPLFVSNAYADVKFPKSPALPVVAN